MRTPNPTTNYRRALLRLAMQCDAKRRRLQALAERSSACESLERTPSIFAHHAARYLGFCDFLRRAAGGPVPVPSAADVDGSASAIDAQFRAVMRSDAPPPLKLQIGRRYDELRRAGRRRRRGRLGTHHRQRGAENETPTRDPVPDLTEPR